MKVHGGNMKAMALCQTARGQLFSTAQTVCQRDLKASRRKDPRGKYLARDPFKCACGQGAVNGSGREQRAGHTVLSGQRHGTAPCSSRSRGRQRYSEQPRGSVSCGAVPRAASPPLPSSAIPQLAASAVSAKVSRSGSSRLDGISARQPILSCATPSLAALRAICGSQVLRRDAGVPGAAHREPAAAETVQARWHWISVWKSGGSALALSLRSVLLCPYPLRSH